MPVSGPPEAGVTLTPKEAEVLAHVAAGRTDDEIAAALSISRSTVDTHMRHIFLKLEVNNRVTAVVKGIMLGLIDPKAVPPATPR